MTRKFTGWHMFAILVAFFGTVIAVNFTMARYASSTFGGIVVENSYVASEKFNGWLAKARAQEGLEWDAGVTRREDGTLALTLSGTPDSVSVSAVARHPLGRLPDQILAFERAADGTWLSREPLADGRWTLRIELSSGPDRWASEEPVE